ncbi:MAG TPA: TonB-dependent siderophore receptor [Methylorubrum populi]|uniref:TonB-dependent siderophore receptor n=1 Tax=Methylorubrum populi TaxID=223967 RepID=A0A921E3V3_9HYPH|nr:TonB-dependent siderophore receptor [Methylorubrum populi]
MFEHRVVLRLPSQRTGWALHLLASTILSGALLGGSARPSLAQVAPDAAVELSELSVTGERRGPTLGGALYGPGGASGPVPGYVASRSTVATKTDTPILETAQSISVVGRAQIEDQNALTVNQALRYTPGASVEQRGGAGSTRLEQFFIRGFAAPTFLDGLRLPGSRDAYPSVDPYNLERIDIIKGPASVLYGQAGPGGLVNLVSKLPQFVAHREVFIQGGGFDEVRGGVDVGGPVGDGTGGLADQFAYRVVASGRMGDGPVDFTRVERAFIAPSFTWRPDADTSLTVLARYQRDPFSGYYGAVPAKGSVFPSNFGIPGGRLGYLPTTFYDGDRSYERSDRTIGSIGYIFDHRFDDSVRFHSSTRYLHSEGDYRSVYTAFQGNGPSWAGRFLSRGYGGTRVAIDAYTTDNNLEFRFATGIFDHTLLFGIDHQTIRTTTFGTGFPNAPQLDLLNPNNNQGLTPLPFTSFQDLAASQTGAYVQDQIRFDNLILTLGGRFDRARQEGPTYSLPTGRLTTLQDARSEAFTYRASLLYRSELGVSPYVSYSEAFEPLVSGAIYDGDPNGLGRLPDPQTSRQYEAGVKYQPPGTDILLSAAAFDIKQQNRLQPDPVNGNRFSIQNGEVGVQGVEFEARANLAEGLRIVGGFSLLDARVTRDTTTTLNELTGGQVPLLGKTPVQIPDATASVFVDYRILEGPLRGVGVGGGVRWISSQWGDPANTFRVPEAYLLDAVASYDFGQFDPAYAGLDLQLNIQNLLDERYVTSCFNYSACYYGLPRTVFATLRYRW